MQQWHFDRAEQCLSVLTGHMTSEAEERTALDRLAILAVIRWSREAHGVLSELFEAGQVPDGSLSEVGRDVRRLLAIKGK